LGFGKSAEAVLGAGHMVLGTAQKEGRGAVKPDRQGGKGKRVMGGTEQQGHIKQMRERAEVVHNRGCRLYTTGALRLQKKLNQSILSKDRWRGGGAQKVST